MAGSCDRLSGGRPMRSGTVAAGEHRRLLECALNRDWNTAQATLTKHVNDCVDQMISKRLVL